MAIHMESIRLLTSDGVGLDGDVAVPAGPRAGAVVCHPHPLYGGDRHNPVVTSVVGALADAGVVALRFDFRGVGASEGAHGGGVSEVHDVVAALDELVTRCPDLPIWLVGYSFGSIVALSVADVRAAGWVAIAPPLAAMGGRPAAADDPRPVHLIVAGHDQFSPPDTTASLTADWAATTTAVLPAADHFLAGHLADVAGRVTAAITVAITG